jgi:hypothetical protein
MWFIMVDQKSIQIDQKLIHNLCNGKNLDDNKKGLDLLIESYTDLHDKQTAWQDLINLTNLLEIKDDEISKRQIKSIKLKAIKFLTKEIPNKFEANDFDELFDILKAIRLVPFDLWIEKDLIWRYLIKLIDDERPRFSTDGASVLRSMFIHVENKKKATDDLFRLTKSRNEYTKYFATFTLGYRFNEIKDKQENWQRFYNLYRTKDTVVLRGIALSIGYVIQFLNNEEEKTEAWEILNEFLHKQDEIIKLGAVSSLSYSLRYFSDNHREKAIGTLYKLVKESDNEDIISMVAIALGYNYSKIADKNSVYEYLINLSNSNSLPIKCYACHSLGRVYIYKTASSDIEERKENLKRAIDYYKEAEKCSSYEWSNTSHFCRIFYETLFDLFYGRIHLTEDEITKRFDFPISSENEQHFSENEQKIKEKLLKVLKNSAFLINESNDIDPNSTENNKVFDDLNNHCDTILWTLDEVKHNYPFLNLAVRRIIIEESLDPIELIRNKFEYAASKNHSYDYISQLAKQLQRHDKKNAEYVDIIAKEFRKLAPPELNKSLNDNLDEIIKEKNCQKKLGLLAEATSKLNNSMLLEIYWTTKKTHEITEQINDKFDKLFTKLDDLEISIESSKITGGITISGGPLLWGLLGVSCEINIPILEIDVKKYFNRLKNSKIKSIRIGDLQDTIGDKIKKIISSPNNKQMIIEGLNAKKEQIYLNP